MSVGLPKIAITFYCSPILAILDIEAEFQIVSKEVVKLAKLITMYIVVPTFAIAEGISTQPIRVLKVALWFMDKVQDHVIDVMVGSQVHVILLGIDFGWKLGFEVCYYGPQAVIK